MKSYNFLELWSLNIGFMSIFLKYWFHIKTFSRVMKHLLIVHLTRVITLGKVKLIQLSV